MYIPKPAAPQPTAATSRLLADSDKIAMHGPPVWVRCNQGISRRFPTNAAGLVDQTTYWLDF